MSTALTVAVSVTSLSQSSSVEVGLLLVKVQVAPGSKSPQSVLLWVGPPLSTVSVMTQLVSVTSPVFLTVMVNGIGWLAWAGAGPNTFVRVIAGLTGIVVVQLAVWVTVPPH